MKKLDQHTTIICLALTHDYKIVELISKIWSYLKIKSSILREEIFGTRNQNHIPSKRHIENVCQISILLTSI